MSLYFNKSFERATVAVHKWKLRWMTAVDVGGAGEPVETKIFFVFISFYPFLLILKLYLFLCFLFLFLLLCV